MANQKHMYLNSKDNGHIHGLCTKKPKWIKTHNEYFSNTKTRNERVRLFVNDILNEIIFRCYYDATINTHLTLD